MTDQRVQTWLHGGDQLPVFGQDKNTAGTDNGYLQFSRNLSRWFVI